MHLLLPLRRQATNFSKQPTWLAISLAGVLALGIFVAEPAPAQVLTHGPVVGGVTDTEAKVFVRTDVAATVVLQYSTDPVFGTYSASGDYATAETSDFTSTISLSGLTAETTYYLRVLVNGQ